MEEVSAGLVDGFSDDQLLAFDARAAPAAQAMSEWVQTQPDFPLLGAEATGEAEGVVGAAVEEEPAAEDNPAIGEEEEGPTEGAETGASSSSPSDLSIFDQE